MRGIVLSICAAVGGVGRMVICSAGLVLTAVQAQATGCESGGTRFKPYDVKLLFEESQTPGRGHPYSLSPADDPFVLQHGECGTWAIRNFELSTVRNGIKGHPVGRPRRFELPDRSTEERALYSIGGRDVFTIPVLLLAQSPTKEGDFNDREVWNLATNNRQTFQNLDIHHNDAHLKNHWKFQPIRTLPDRTLPDGTRVIANFIVSCGEETCNNSQLAEATNFAMMALVGELERRRPPTDNKIADQTKPDLLKSAENKSTEHSKTETRPASLRFYDSMTGQPAAGKWPVSAFTYCDDREWSDKTASTRNGTTVKIDILDNPARGEPAGLCLVFDMDGSDRCYRLPLAVDDKGKPYFPPVIDIPMLSVEALSAHVCPPLPPYAVEMKLAALDGKPSPPSLLRDLTGANPKLFGRDVVDSMVFDKSELLQLRATAQTGFHPETLVKIDRRAATVESVQFDAKSRRVAVSFKLQALPIGAMRFDLLTGKDEDRSCDPVLEVPATRQLGPAWPRNQALRLAYHNGKGYSINLDDSQKAALYVSMAPGEDDSASLRLKPRPASAGGTGEWGRECAVRPGQDIVRRDELIKGVLTRNVAVQGPVLAGFLTADPELSGLLPASDDREALFGLGAGIMNKLSQRRPRVGSGFSLGTLVDAQAGGDLGRGDLGRAFKIDVLPGETLPPPAPEKIRMISQRTSPQSTMAPLPAGAVGLSLDQVLSGHKLADEGLPADVVFFGKALTRFGSLCDRSPDQTVKGWGNAWRSGDRRLMVVTSYPARTPAGWQTKRCWLRPSPATVRCRSTGAPPHSAAPGRSTGCWHCRTR
jgi:hypothetical protein